MMRALPGSTTTVSRHVLSQLKEPKGRVTEMVNGLASKLAVNVDVWTLGNYVCFLGVVTYFAGK